MKNEELQQLIFDSLGGCSWEYDLPAEDITYSDEFFELLGYRADEREIDKGWVADNIHPGDLPQWRDAFVRSIKGHSKYFDCELRFRHKDDRYIWIQTRGVVTERDELGRALRIIGMVFDISERKAARENESRYQLFLDNIPDALSLKDRDGKYLYINRQFENWLGKPSYQIYGQTAGEIFHPDTQTLDLLREHERRVWEQGETISMERQFPLTEAGAFRHALITKFPVFDESGEILAIGTTNTDLTERYRAQEALLASEHRYRRLFESAPAVLAESDWTNGKALIDDLKRQGVEDLTQHLIDHPELTRYRKQIMQIRNFNQEALRIYKADSIEQLIRHTEGEMSEVQRMGMIEDLMNFANGQRRSTVYCRTFRVTGEDFPILVESEIYGADPDDWTKILLTIRDTSVEEAMRLSAQRYRRLFESAPAVLCETDWTKGKELIDSLRQQGIKNIRQHLIDHPELMRRQDQIMKLLDVNHEALRIYRAKDAEALINYAESELSESQRLSLIEELNNFASEQRRSTIRSRNWRLDGEEFPVIREVEIYSEDPEDWSQVLLTVRDISAEEAVRMSEIRFRRLFESSPAALYESDWTNGKNLVERLRQEGVENIRQHLLDNPQLIQRRDDVHTILNANEDAISMYLSTDKESHIAFVEGEITDDQRLALIEVLETFATGKRRSQVRTSTVRENGEVFPIVRNCELISGQRDDWSLVLVSIQDMSVEEEAARQLEAYQEELRSLAGQISLAEESERRRISSELHDGTIQNLVLARIHLANLRTTLETEKGEQLTDSINDLLETSLRETRSLIFEISPPVLYELGLEPAVEWLAEHYKQRTGAEVRITSDERSTRLAADMNVVVFQTVRELLVNIAKHAQAQQVSIDWQHHDNNVVLIVQDDGVGFDTENPQLKRATEGGFGLFAVKERLKLLGADIDIESSGKGTCVTITAPVEAG